MLSFYYIWLHSLKCSYKLVQLNYLWFYLHRKSSYQLNVKRLNMTANRSYEGAQPELYNVLTKVKGKCEFYSLLLP